MANTIKTTNRTIEVSAIDEDYMMDTGLNVQSVVFIPGTVLKDNSIVAIIEGSANTPVKAVLTSTIATKEARAWIFNQRLQLGFVFADGVFNSGSKVIFNLGELHSGNDAISTRMKMKLNAEDIVP